jgi:benzoate-CoA ligase
VKGSWVCPAEVESALIQHPAVLQAAVVGHKDAEGLIKAKAFVVLEDPSLASDALCAELMTFTREKLAPYKCPRWVEFKTDLPMTATGKIQRFKLRS